MKISSAYLFSRAVDQMSTLQNNLAKTQSQLAAGKQVLLPSDAPDQVATIERYKSLLSRHDSYQNTINSVNSRLQTEDSALASVSTLLIRMKELSIQAANDTLGSSDRQALASEMQGLRDQVLSLANSQDSSGNYIFGGSRVGAAPFAGAQDESPIYQGDQSRMAVPVGDQRSVMINRPGSEVFGSAVRTNASGQPSGVEFFQAIDDMVLAVKGSDQPNMKRSLGEMDALLSHIDMARAQVGTDQNVLSAQQSVLEDSTLALKNVLSGIEDLDYASAVSRLNQQSLSLQAAQSSFAKISQLNLFNYIN